MATISESPRGKEDNLPIASEKGDGKTKYEVLTASPSHAEAGIITNVRLDPFGNPLQPDPTSDPLDPLNWSLVQKYVIIVIVCINYFLFTYLTTAPTLSFPLLQEQFAATYTEVNWTFAIPSLGLAVGPLFWSSFADTYGRRIVMISGTALALLSSGCTSMHDITINQYMAARFFQGFGAAPAATVGLSIIQDLSWEHERGFRVGLWVLAIGLGAPFGSLIGGFLATVDQYWVAYHVTILFAALLVLQCVFMPETLYPRALVVSSEAAGNGEKSDGTDVALPKRTRELGLIYFGKIPGLAHYPKPWHTLIRSCRVIAYPQIAISVFAYVFGQYWWLLSFLTMIPAAYADYSVIVQGLFLIGMIIGTVIAEFLFSGRLSDILVGRLAARKQGVKTPEMRLWLGYPSVILVAVGLVVWGFSIERGWHWMTGQVAFALFGAGVQMGNTAVSSYIVDCYPEHAMDVITFYSVFLNLSAFIEPWFINTWVEANGYALCFGAQAIICVLFTIPCYAAVQYWGKQWRRPMRLGDD